MSLEKYKAKRKFGKTPEPRPKRSAHRGGQARFVIHKHQARNLHYDLRLEMQGVLKSWAVPKQPPRKKGIKRLAVQVEDHPLEYASFEGVIPEGNYGAGRVDIWDRGTYEVKRGDKDDKGKEGRKKGAKGIKGIGNAFKFELRGKKLRGEYALVRMKDKQWLFFKVN